MKLEDGKGEELAKDSCKELRNRMRKGKVVDE